MSSQRAAQRPIPSKVDLRDMLRRHIIARSLACMEASASRRRECLATGNINAYRQEIRAAARGFYGSRLPAGKEIPLQAREVSRFEKPGYRLENLLFDSFPGWQVNATVYVPLDYAPPFPAVIIPVGHSGKQFKSYQLPARFFARNGYLAVLYDPPGQAGEKQAGNDHFVDGVRCYLVGETSSQYFVGDALRCIDYLETRADVDLNNGVAMTGVSGGGTTTTLAALLDRRITIAGPSCCLSPLADLDISQCYAGCPETHMWRRYAEGIDEVDLLCAAFPTPTLLMAGEYDEVFHIEDTLRLAAEAQLFFEQAGAAERFEFFVDQAGHGYSLAQARRFVGFMNRWLLDQPKRPIPDLPDDAFALDPGEQLKCYPRPDVNMRSLTLKRANELEAARDQDAERIRRAAFELAGSQQFPAVPKAVTNRPFQVWTHHWQQILLQPEAGIEMPATFLYPQKCPAAAILHFDDQHRNRLLYRGGTLAQAARFLQQEQTGLAVFNVDVRGWGDSAPAMYPYEMASWGGIDRYLAYATAALGDSIMAMRIRDGLAALAYLRSRPEIAPQHIALSGCGLGGIVALHVAALDGQVSGVAVWNSLFSFKTLLEEKAYTWPADTFIPQVLLHYDLPELAASLACPARILSPLDGRKQPLPDDGLQNLNSRLAQPIYRASAGAVDIVSAVQENFQDWFNLTREGS